MATKPKNVIIIGGSLAGLMSGIVLKNLGHNVRIFERSSSVMLQSQGAGIVFGPDAQEYFSKHIKVKRDLSVSSFARQTLNKKGEVMDRDEREQKMVSWDLLYFVLRAAFDDLESEYCEVPERVSGDESRAQSEPAQGKVDDRGRAEYLYGRKALKIRDVDEEVEVVFESKEDGEKTERAEMVIAADGPSSTIRKLLLPEIERTFAGYVAWRGTVPEGEASQRLKDTFVDKFTFYHGPGTQILSYLIPAGNGELKPGKRLINYVWYCNYEENSCEFEDLMTDTEEHRHPFTMPAGKIKSKIWRKQKSHAKDVLPPAFAELVTETKEPFVQAITDVISPQVFFMGGKVLMVGDAVAGFRPHTAASTSQAARHALLLDEMMRGGKSREQMETEMMAYAKRGSESGKKMGNRSQFGDPDSWKQ